MREETSRCIEALQLLSLRPFKSSKVVNYTRGYQESGQPHIVFQYGNRVVPVRLPVCHADRKVIVTPGLPSQDLRRVAHDGTYST